MNNAKYRELWATVVTLSLALVGAFAPDAYLPMLFRAFIVPLALALGLLAAASTLWRRWWLAQGALLGVAILLIHVPVASVEQAGSGRTALRIFHMNVLQPNTAFAEAIAVARASDADVISVQEVGAEWAEALLQGLVASHPYAHLEPRNNCYGVALFSKRPFQKVELLEVEGTPFIEARIDMAGRSVRLLAVHATSPISYEHFRRRNVQLELLGAHLACIEEATILVGDLNTVPWDTAFARFCGRTGLRSTTRAFQRTWPALGPLAAIPLDHVLVSPEVGCAALRTVHIPGSDHRGLLAELTL